MKLKKLYIRNFNSYGNNVTTIPLDFPTPILIIGENHDSMVNGEYDNNGSGKSTILNALIYAFYNRVLDNKIKLDSLINNINKKNLYVAVVFEKNGVFYKIERYRKNKGMGGTGVAISTADSEDGFKDPETPAGRTVEEYIQGDIMGDMPLEIFIRIVTYSAKSDSFLSLPVVHASQPSQTTMLEELFNQTELTDKAMKLKEKIKETTGEINTLSELSDRIKVETTRYQEQLDMANASVERWEVDKQGRIEAVKSQIDELEKIDFVGELDKISEINTLNTQVTDLNTKLSETLNKIEQDKNNRDAATKWVDRHNDSINEIKSKLQKFDNIDYDEEERKLNIVTEKREKIRSLEHSVKEIQSKRDVLLNEIKQLDKEVNTLKESKCPYCNQTLHDNKDLISSKNDVLKGKALEFKKMEENLIDVNVEVTDLKSEVDSISLLFSNPTEWQKSKSSLEANTTKLEDILKETNPYSGMILSDNELDSLKINRSELESNKKIILEKIDNISTTYTQEEIYEKKTLLGESRKNLVTIINEQNPHKETVDRLEKAFEGMDKIPVDEIENLKKMLKHQDFLYKLLYKKDSFIRQSLLDTNLPLLNSRLRHYLDFVGLPHNAMFTKEMTIAISQFGNTIEYSNLSSGQQARINLAIAFAFRDVFQARHGKINLCILDECLDVGLSNLGVKLAAEMIKDVAAANDLSMYVITHRDEIKSSFSKTLTTRLKGGLTTIEFN